MKRLVGGSLAVIGIRKGKEQPQARSLPALKGRSYERVWEDDVGDYTTKPCHRWFVRVRALSDFSAGELAMWHPTIYGVKRGDGRALLEGWRFAGVVKRDVKKGEEVWIQTHGETKAKIMGYVKVPS